MCPACSNERTARQTVTKQRPKSHDQRYRGGRAVASIFFYQGKRKFGTSSRSPRSAGPRAGWVIGNGAASPLSTSYGVVWGSAVSSPSVVRGGAPVAKRFSRVQSGFSRQFCVYCFSFHSSNFCQGKSYEKQPRRLGFLNGRYGTGRWVTHRVSSKISMSVILRSVILRQMNS